MTTETLSQHPWLADPCHCTTEVCFPTKDCPDGCQGTGKRHSWAWGRCPTNTHNPCIIDRGGSSYEIEHYPDCDGSGWVLAVTEAKCWDAAMAHGDPQYNEVIKELMGLCPMTSPGGRSLLRWWGAMSESERIQCLLVALAAAMDILRQVS